MWSAVQTCTIATKQTERLGKKGIVQMASRVACFPFPCFQYPNFISSSKVSLLRGLGYETKAVKERP